ncbi:Aste57867_12070 [Aphanomyces stellatus]|uniref:Aste57867_12070 protein n=1 Tax=Aphanomyces stellatus TaxID=120398 RepID=A0A485KV19_9STRA|nr:hypothetical protein As57867_012025 [Aphanomyces stellatus]VFT88925.1 Aste57867_12070 [Aphanomyces stellatus]
MDTPPLRPPSLMAAKSKRRTYRAIAALLAVASLLLLAYSGSRNHITSIVRRALKQDGHMTASCSTDADCREFGTTRRPQVCIDKFCAPRPLFPLNSVDLAGTIGAFVCILISSGGGLGGGGLLVPLYIIVLGFSSHDAIPLSKATIFGSALASCLLNFRQKHPLVPHRQLIDYEVMVMMEPMTLAGTIIGVSMNKVCPEWVITILLVVLLSKTSQRMVTKGKSIWQQEDAKDRAIAAKVLAHWTDLVLARKHSPAVVACARKWRQAATVTAAHVVSVELSSVVEADDDTSDDEASLLPSDKRGLEKPHQDLGEMQTKYKQSVPWGDLSVLFLAWLGLFVYSMLKGGHGAPSIVGMVCGSTAYWSLTVLVFPFFAAVTSYFGVKVLHRHELMQRYGYEYVAGDIQWNRHTTVLYPALCTVAGVAAGLLGIGGGMVKGPLLLEIGLHPQVASGTSSAMILFTSSATTIQFIVLGMLPHNYAIWYGVVGFVGSLLGQIGLSYLIRKYRKTAFVLFVIAGVIGASGTVMGFLGIQVVLLHGFRGFRSLCYAV